MGELLTMLDGRIDFTRLQAAAVWGVDTEEQQAKPTKLYGDEAKEFLRSVR